MNAFKNENTRRWENGVETIEGYIGLFLIAAVSWACEHTDDTRLRWSGLLRVANSNAEHVAPTQRDEDSTEECQDSDTAFIDQILQAALSYS